MIDIYHLATAIVGGPKTERRTVDDGDLAFGVTLADEVRDTWRRIRRLADGTDYPRQVPSRHSAVRPSR